MPDFDKTETYGLFKPGVATLDWARLLGVNWDMLDALMARLEAKIVRLENANSTLTGRVSELEAQAAQQVACEPDGSDDPEVSDDA